MDSFFKPKSVALIGASRTPGKVGYSLWQQLKAWGGKAYAVNPKFGYKSISAIKKPVELVVIAVPAPLVPALVNQAINKKVKAVIVISSGFAEMGDKGVKLEPPPLPLLGPNCLGLANPGSKLDLTFSKTSPPPGNIGLISQSGALASYLFNWAKEERLGFSKFVSLGNRLNLDENVFLKYLGNDPDTKLIGLYLESFQNGEAWLKTASRVTRKKPVIVLFAGQTQAGRQASQSHTASLSPSAAVVTTALNQSGCLQAKDIADFTNLLEVFSLEPKLADNDLAIVTNAGGPSILATDTAASLHLDVSRPIDVLGDADAQRFQAGFDQAIKDKTRDAFLIIITPQSNTELEPTCRAIVKRFAHLTKPLIVSLLGGRLSDKAKEILRVNRVATIDLPQDASRSLAALLEFYRKQKHRLYPVRRPYRLKQPPLPSRFILEGRITWQQAQALTRSYSIPLVKTSVLTQPLKPAAFSWPLVVKADPAASIHRTEDKAIYLNLNSSSALKLAYRRLRAKFPLILLQEQVREGHELFISLKREANWPPLLTLGGGGIYTELYQDVSRVFLPVNAKLITKVLAQTNLGQIFLGYRGGTTALLEPAIRLILNCCRLFEEHPKITELEINPALVARESVWVVDIKIVVD